MTKIPETLEEARKLPEEGGGVAVYFMWRGDELLYIGGSRQVSQRIDQHHRTRRYGELHAYARKFIPFDRVTIFKCEMRELYDLETTLTKRFQPSLCDREDGGNKWVSG